MKPLTSTLRLLPSKAIFFIIFLLFSSKMLVAQDIHYGLGTIIKTLVEEPQKMKSNSGTMPLNEVDIQSIFSGKKITPTHELYYFLNENGYILEGVNGPAYYSTSAIYPDDEDGEDDMVVDDLSVSLQIGDLYKEPGFSDGPEAPAPNNVYGSTNISYLNHHIQINMYLMDADNGEVFFLLEIIKL